MGDLPVNPLVLIGVGSSFAFSGLFYHLYKGKKEELKKLKEIPIFKPDQHLVKVLKASPHRRLQYVAVEGLVQADGESLASQFVPRCYGVIQKIAVEEQWKFWNSLTKTWNSRTINRKETNNSVPFSLVSPGAFIDDLYVKVQNPLEASGCYLDRVYFKRSRAEKGLADMVMNGILGEEPVAMEVSEELLRVGSTLTGYGEVVLEGGQVMRLQAPQDGRKFILVPTDHRSFMDGHEKSASMWKMLSAVTGITGAAILTKVICGLVGNQDGKSKKA
ncbi:mitochondrial ubiquitin ligase activator of nfkb 1-A [Gymnodraco acuticeps]|uniref:RING-type E3 ubiquitin transferase n=1 Tax=Gymnodraco acuticeps TaxID=8218 RepID=A0A6P8VMI8_GYMAC|nr:mitochondrial ubiquitin ligase activator of nfkb 1-A [Gymnodraco acuticeps]XP_034087906.1 mitochondrial ubiquitin ligase activator of nfkb 1-A [Gymnodraco acuticeps]XP_034087907.1 mitochondrial ubiquitin ligase activator of nfkb 1-A [Gymnodraco acuticeps]